jgi:hypothetical protein
VFARQLSRELAVLIAFKIAALAVLFFVFFGPTQRPKADAATISHALLSDERGQP